MDKFTKTTEIDISAMNDVMEEETPKKSNLGKIISIIVSLIIAIAIWLYITDNDTKEIIFEDVAVINSTETVDVKVVGASNAREGLQKEDIKVTKTEDGKYKIDGIMGLSMSICEEESK